MRVSRVSIFVGKKIGTEASVSQDVAIGFTVSRRYCNSGPAPGKSLTRASIPTRGKTKAPAI